MKKKKRMKMQKTHHYSNNIFSIAISLQF